MSGIAVKDVSKPPIPLIIMANFINWFFWIMPYRWRSKISRNLQKLSQKLDPFLFIVLIQFIEPIPVQFFFQHYIKFFILAYFQLLAMRFSFLTFMLPYLSTFLCKLHRNLSPLRYFVHSETFLDYGHLYYTYALMHVSVKV